MPRVPSLPGVVVLFLLIVPLSARAADLTLRDVIELHRAGLGDELLIEVIQADGGPFALSFADIMDLKTEGLGERVIAALVRTRSLANAGAVPVRPLDEAVPFAAGAVQQQITQGAPTVVVVETVVPYLVPYVATSPRGDGRYGDEHGDHDRRRHRDRHDSRRASPATWVTRAEDGRNIAPSGRPVRTDAPPATWVTPNEIPTGSRAGGDRSGRGADRQDRRARHHEEDRRDRRP